MNGVDVNIHAFQSDLYRGVVKEAMAFFDQIPLHELPPSSSFPGCGIYALYYLGDSQYYRKLSEKVRAGELIPIYVGKAVPPGWRTARTEATGKSVLFNRLREHARNIQQVNNLRVSDFRCKFIIFNDPHGDLVGSVEAGLIRKYSPLWNSVVDGFGNHDPGSGRYDQAKSEWDVLHKGRLWAQRLKGRSPIRSRVIEKISRSFE